MTNRFNFLTGRENYELTSLQGYRVHKKILTPLTDLIDLARKEIGSEISIISSFRDFERQSLIWNGKARGERKIFDDQGELVNTDELTSLELAHKIMRFSAIPGLSRHHWGTDIDIFDGLIMSKEEVSLTAEECEGPMKKLHSWLDEKIANQEAFGFFRPYDSDLGGVAKEKWHLSYAPVAQELYEEYDLEVFTKNIDMSDIDLKGILLENAEEIFERYFKRINL